MKNTVTAGMIRKYVIDRYEGVRKVKITRTGEVHCYGDMPRGDGGRKPWWMLVGSVDYVKQCIAAA